MANGYLLFDDRIAAATLTGDAGVAGLPLANLQDPQPTKVARWQATSGYVVADFGAAVPVGGLVLHGTNLSAAATRRVRLSSADATGAAGDVHDSGAAAAGVLATYRGSFAYMLSSDLSARYLRLDLADASLSFIDAGVLLAGPVFRPARNFSYGASIGFQEFGRNERSPVGITFTSQRARARALSLRFEYASASEAYGHLLELQRLAGITRNVALVPDPGGTNAAKQLMVGTLQDLTPISNTFYNIHSTTLSLVERI